MPSKRVHEFYNSNSFAILGFSRDEKSFTWATYKELSLLQKKIYAINPKGGEFQGLPLHKSLKDLPEKPDALIVATSIKKNNALLDEISAAGIKKVWFQQGVCDNAIINSAKGKGIDPIKGCVLMHLPNGHKMHSFHRFFNELFTKGYQ
jgi:predicted CoA-binding protein